MPSHNNRRTPFEHVRQLLVEAGFYSDELDKHATLLQITHHLSRAQALREAAETTTVNALTWTDNDPEPPELDANARYFIDFLTSQLTNDALHEERAANQLRHT